MRHYDKISGLFWVVIGMVFCIGALNIGLGTPRAPRGGFFPFLGGVTMVSLGLILFLQSIFQRRMKHENGENLIKKESLIKLPAVFLVLLAYGILLERLGFLLTTFFLMISLLAFRVPRRWTSILVISILTSLLSYVFFVILLKVLLPQGISPI